MNYIAYIKDFFEIKIIKKNFFKRNEILKEDTINSLYLHHLKIKKSFMPYIVDEIT